jgi:hypothetical protein
LVCFSAAEISVCVFCSLSLIQKFYGPTTSFWL